MESSTMGTSTKEHNFTFFIKQDVFFHRFSISASFKDWPLPSPFYSKVVLGIMFLGYMFHSARASFHLPWAVISDFCNSSK